MLVKRRTTARFSASYDDPGAEIAEAVYKLRRVKLNRRQRRLIPIAALQLREGYNATPPEARPARLEYIRSIWTAQHASATVRGSKRAARACVEVLRGLDSFRVAPSGKRVGTPTLPFYRAESERYRGLLRLNVNQGRARVRPGKQKRGGRGR